jgi:hypothetical protein
MDLSPGMNSKPCRQASPYTIVNRFPLRSVTDVKATLRGGVEVDGVVEGPVALTKE